MPQKQQSYTVSEKRAAVQRIEELSGQLSRGGDDPAKGNVAVVAKERRYPHDRVHGSWLEREKLMRFAGLSKAKTLIGQGRYGFSTRKPQAAKMATDALDDHKLKFALKFWNDLTDAEVQLKINLDSIYNVDETAINFDMPEARMWGDAWALR
ncbi:hypothetical protein PybrP1_005811 [[Pythium] brassicae (nom. inval.)]|nr:hypothetical protein PybrP1_005811 [[Pythium] brassicae (nom. inval.)]